MLSQDDRNLAVQEATKILVAAIDKLPGHFGSDPVGRTKSFFSAVFDEIAKKLE